MFQRLRPHRNILFFESHSLNEMKPEDELKWRGRRNNETIRILFDWRGKNNLCKCKKAIGTISYQAHLCWLFAVHRGYVSPFFFLKESAQPLWLNDMHSMQHCCFLSLECTHNVFLRNVYHRKECFGISLFLVKKCFDQMKRRVSKTTIKER